jgi:hypothetical protein
VPKLLAPVLKLQLTWRNATNHCTRKIRTRCILFHIDVFCSAKLDQVRLNLAERQVWSRDINQRIINLARWNNEVMKTGVDQNLIGGNVSLKRSTVMMNSFWLSKFLPLRFFFHIYIFHINIWCHLESCIIVRNWDTNWCH